MVQRTRLIFPPKPRRDWWRRGSLLRTNRNKPTTKPRRQTLSGEGIAKFVRTLIIHPEDERFLSNKYRWGTKLHGNDCFRQHRFPKPALVSPKMLFFDPHESSCDKSSISSVPAANSDPSFDVSPSPSFATRRVFVRKSYGSHSVSFSRTNQTAA